MENYGKTVLETLQRSDLGDSGSFGGKMNSEEEIVRDPVIFVHGMSDFAGGKMQALAATYRKLGYTSGELYATSYDNGPRNNPIAWAEYSLKCEHVKQIRTLILAVRYYTLREVDIIAYSLGVPLARKAVLGGLCVDTKENLGPRLTSHIDAFIGVAGPNHGISLQIAGVSIPGCVIGAIPILPICSKVIGLYSGFCPTESQFLTDINEFTHYEGRYVYTLYTETDIWIGYKICDQITARIPGEDGHKLYRTYSHEDIVLRTSHMQMKMIQAHSLRNKIGTKTNLNLSSRSTYSAEFSNLIKQGNTSYPKSNRFQHRNKFSTNKPHIPIKHFTDSNVSSTISHSPYKNASKLINTESSEDQKKYKTPMMSGSIGKAIPTRQVESGFHTYINVSF